MTDDQLLHLIETTAPEELTLAELELLRRRLAESPELRAALFSRLQMEQYLANALGRINISVDDIVARAGGAPARSANPVLPVLGWVLCLLLVGFVGLVLLLAVTIPPVNSPTENPAVASATGSGSESPADDAETKVPDQALEVPPAQELVAADEATAAKPTTPPTPAAAPEPAVKKAPWEELAAAEDRPRPSATVLFDPINSSVPAPHEDDLKQWFVEVKDQPHNVSRKDFAGSQCAVLDGLWRLRAPLHPKTALRLALGEHHNYKLHFWHGTTGITLQFYENANQLWVAYATTRKDTEPKPLTFALAATDEDRYWRTNPLPAASFELRAEDGVLILSRGDVRVLSVPFAGAPSEIYFEGHAVFRQIALATAAELPNERPPHPVLVDAGHPAQLHWAGELTANTDFRKHPDGRVELVADKNDQPAWVSWQLPHRDSLTELVVQLDNPLPGTGLFLGDDQGPRYNFGFFREASSGGRTSFGLIAPGDNRQDANHDINGGPAPLAAPQPWFKLVFGCGVLKAWTSIDGVHWGRASEPWSNLQLPFTHFGLYCLAGVPNPHSIQLKHLQVRELAGLNALAPLELRRQALALPQAADGSDWLVKVLDKQPLEADSGAWRRACALRTLAAGTSAAFGVPLLESLIDDGLRDNRPAAEQLKMLDDAALLWPSWEDQNTALRVAQYYERLGQLAYRRGQTHPLTLVGHAQRTAPIWSRGVYNFLPDALMRVELLELAQAGNWGELHEYCREQQFWRRPAQPQTPPPTLVEWADALAARQLPSKRGQAGPVLAADWRHPLLVELSKEDYNVLAELRGALDGKAYRDACQIISSSAEGGSHGLLPDSRDAELLVSLPGAVALAMRDHPALRTTMSDQFAPLGRLRIRQFISDVDVTGVEAATIQFYGTPAAAEAHLWLGDRALSSGAFAHALGQYREAALSAAPELGGRLAASQQLAAALMGQVVGEPATRSVTFGDTELSAEQFQKLVTDLRTHRTADNLVQHTDDSAGAARGAPAPTAYDAVVKFRLEGDGGHEPQNIPGEISTHHVDWLARQVATVVDGDRLLLSNRFQLTAYDLKTNQLQWRSELGGEHGPTHDWPSAAMRPLVTTSRIFCRRLHKSGPVLACFNTSDGKVLWNSKIEPEKWVVSDPLLIQEELFALMMSRTEQEFTLHLATFDPQSGAVLSSRSLVRFREPWWQERTCQVTAHGDTLIATCGGSVLCCDLLGQVRWVRRQTWLPPNLDRTWLAQAQEPPLVAGGKLFVVQPGVKQIVALEPESGRLEWRRVLTGARRIVGLVEDRLIVETDDGFVAFDAADGKPLWYHDVQLAGQPSYTFAAQLCGAPGGLLYARPEPVRGENNFRPQLVWVDLKTGLAQAQTTLAALKHDQPRLGPFIRHGERLLVLFGRGEREATRDVVELTANGSAQNVPATPGQGLDMWNRATDPTLRSAAGEALPKWTLIGGRIDGQTGLLADWLQEKNVLSTLSIPARPLTLARRVNVPAEGQPRLRLRVSNAPNGKWKLEVRAGGTPLLVQDVDQAYTGGAWKDVEVDLKPVAGKHVWLLVRQLDEGAPESYARWQRLELAN